MNVYSNHSYQCGFPTPFSPPGSFSSNGVPFQANSPLGAKRPGMGRLIGGLVGSVLGQILCPIPFVGAMLGGLIGSMFGSMLDNLFATSAPCCCHNMGQQYGPMNGQMAYNYGYPVEQPYLPRGFHTLTTGQPLPCSRRINRRSLSTGSHKSASILSPTISIRLTTTIRLSSLRPLWPWLERMCRFKRILTATIKDGRSQRPWWESTSSVKRT